MLYKKVIIIVFCCCFTLVAFSQNGTVKKEEVKQSNIDPLIKYFYKDKEEIKHLWKFDAVEWGQLKPSIAFEKKLSNNFSWETGWILISLGFGVGTEESSLITSNELSTEIKYYYNYNSRLKRGKKVNGFSGNYFSFGINSFLNYNGFQDFEIYDPYPVGIEQEKVKLLSLGQVRNTIFNEVNLNYGIQRRMGRIGYIDIKTGCGVGMIGESKASFIQKENNPCSSTIGTIEKNDAIFIHPRVKIRIGFGFKSLKFKKQ